MKKNDLAIVIVATIFSAIVSLGASRFLFNSSGRQQTVEVVPRISASFPTTLDKTYFNDNSIDPTQFIQIGNNTNPNPFK
jgi:hypothetical protein